MLNRVIAALAIALPLGVLLLGAFAWGSFLGALPQLIN